MNNIAPQTPSLNRKLWAAIEGFARYLTKTEGTTYIYTGSFGFKGYIKNKVVVPKYWYKLILVPKTKKAYLFVCENKKYPYKTYSYKDIQKYLVSLSKFNKINKDFNLKLKGNWNFQKTIYKKNFFNKFNINFKIK